MKLFIEVKDKVFAKEAVILFIDINLIIIFKGGSYRTIYIFLFLDSFAIPNAVMSEDYLALYLLLVLA